MAIQRSPKRADPAMVVRALSARATTGFVEIGPLRLPCALGRAGVRSRKREGDGASPRGCFAAREVFYNPARVRRPRTALPLRAIAADDGWCDDACDRNYNRLVRRPYPASAESLWRDDGLYDVVVVLGYNDRPRVKGRGSAIFLHVARPGFAATEGCVAVRRPDALRLLAMLRRGGAIRIGV